MKKGFTIKQRVLVTLAGIFFAGSLVMAYGATLASYAK